eukprot:11065011-Prorocentrum_lima.AAC.1
MAEVAVRIGTWGPDASHQWLDIGDEARQKHDQWSSLTAEQKAQVESSYCYGDKIPLPTPGTVLE